MSFRRIEIDCPEGALEDVQSLKGADCISDHQCMATDNDRERHTLLVGPAQRQVFLDAVQEKLGDGNDWQIVVIPVDGVLPIPDPESDADDEDEIASREEIFVTVTQGAQLGTDFVVLTVAAAIVAAVGMVRDSTAVVIGSMVIAPLIGPILSLVLGLALGERSIIWRSFIAGVSGIAMVVLVGLLAGFVLTLDMESQELMQRTSLGYEVLVLAFVSGIAAALSATTNKLAPLVGVMVAAAILPPFVAVGLFLANGLYGFAGTAALMGVCNVICINFAGQLVFYWKGVRPKSWYQREDARQSVWLSMASLGGSVLLLMLLLGWLQ